MTYKFIEKRGEKDRVRARLSSIYIVPFFRYEKKGNQERLYLKLYGGLTYGSVAVDRVRSNRIVPNRVEMDAVINNKPGQLPEQQAYK